MSPIATWRETFSDGQKLPLSPLSATVVSLMAGIFSLPRTFAIATGLGAIIASCIAGGGMCTLARMFQALAERKPYLDAGVYGYARRFWRLSGVPCGPSSYTTS